MNEKDQRNYDLQKRLIEFAVRVLNVVESLPNSRVGNHVAGQLLSYGSSLSNASRWSSRLTSAARSSMKTTNSFPFLWRVSPQHKRT